MIQNNFSDTLLDPTFYERMAQRHETAAAKLRIDAEAATGPERDADRAPGAEGGEYGAGGIAVCAPSAERSRDQCISYPAFGKHIFSWRSLR